MSKVYKVSWKVRVDRLVLADSKEEALLLAEDLAYGNFQGEPIEYTEITAPKATKVSGS